jgi:hypothetical protein
MSTTSSVNKSRHGIFKGRRKRTGRDKKIPLFYLNHLIADQFDSKVIANNIKNKRELFPELSPASPISLMLPFSIHLLV